MNKLFSFLKNIKYITLWIETFIKLINIFHWLKILTTWKIPLNLILIKHQDYDLVHNHCYHPQYYCYYKGHDKHKTLNILHVQSSSYILHFDMVWLKNNHIGSIVVLLQGLVQHLMGESQDQSTWIAHHMSMIDLDFLCIAVCSIR